MSTEEMNRTAIIAVLILIILAGIGLYDLVAATGVAGTRTSFYAKPGRFADYMLVNAAVPVRRFEVVSAPEVSDHCPLLLET